MTPRRFSQSPVAAAALLILGSLALQAQSTLITDCTDDTQLQAAVKQAGGINFNCSGTIPLSAPIYISNQVSIDGIGETVVINGSVNVTGKGTLTVNHLSMTGGAPTLFVSGGTLIVANSAISGTISASALGVATIINSTLSGNNADGVDASGGAQVAITNSTIVTNNGRGIYFVSSSVTVSNTILFESGNSNCGGPSGGPTDGGYNLSNDNTCGFTAGTSQNNVNAMLGPLANNGGFTPTYSLQTGSPAIGAIPAGTNGCATTLLTDQRGAARPGSVNGACSIGAYEYVTPPTTTVSDCTDDTQIQSAVAAGGRIVFSCSGTIPLASTLNIAGNTIIDAAGETVAFDGGGTRRVISVANGDSLVLNNLTVQNGSTSGTGGGINSQGNLIVTNSSVVGNVASNGENGGGISATGAIAVLSNSTVMRNTAISAQDSGGFGGGIVGAGDLIVTNSTFYDNIATSGGAGGAIYEFPGARLSLTGSTISGNSDGIYSNEASFTLLDTILAANNGRNCHDEGSVTDGGYNLDDDGSCGFTSAHSFSDNPNANLGALGNYGGPTQTVPPLYGSVALNAIPIGANGCGSALLTDQRGVARPQGEGCDIGAFEGYAVPVTFSTIPANLSYSVQCPAAVMYNSGQTLDLLPGRLCTIATSSPQDVSSVEYVWQSWSDGGNLTHDIVIPTAPATATAFTANFVATYPLITASSPANGGSVSGTAYYAPGTVVNLVATPAIGYVFVNWTGASVSSPNNSSTTITTGSAAQTVTANFAAEGANLSVATPPSFTNEPVCPSSGATAACTSTQTYTFTANADVMIGSVNVTTQGISGLDFNLSQATPPTCSGTLQNTATCTVTVTFTPMAAGVRMGAIQLLDPNGNVLDTQFISGIGQGPVVAFSGGSPVSIPMTTPNGCTLSNITAITADAQGNIFAAFNCSGEPVVKYSVGSGTTTTLASVPGGGQSLAIDGAGTLYAGSAAGIVYQIAAGAAVPVASPGNKAIFAMTTDAAGNVFYVEGQTIYRLTPNGSPSVFAQVQDALDRPPTFRGVASDSAGNIYASENVGGIIYKVAAGQNTANPLITGLTLPTGISLDAAGDFYVFQMPDQTAVVTEYAAGNTTTPISLIGSGLQSYSPLAADAGGDLFFLNTSGQLMELPRSHAPAQTFASTSVGTTTGPQTVSLQNIGNTPLTFSAIAYPTDFPEAAGVQTDCSASTPLAAAGICTLSIDFTPTYGSITGASSLLSETVSLTNNAPGSPQTVTVSGTGSQTPATCTVNTSPQGLQVSVNGAAAQPAPVSFSCYLGSANTVVVASTQGGSGTRYIFTAWSDGAGSPSDILKATSSTNTLTANFQTQYLLTAQASPAAGGTISGVTGGGYYNAGATASLTATANAGYVFNGWAGAVTSASASIPISMAQPQTVTANFLATQTISFTLPTSPMALTAATLTASSSANLPIAYSTTTAAVCSVSNNTVQFLTIGTCYVTGMQAGNSAYAAAAVVSHSTVAVGATQAISFSTAPPGTAAVYNSQFTVAAKASSGLAVSYSSSGVCTNVNATYTMTSGTGSCSVMVNQAGNSVYAPGQVSLPVAAALANQTITFNTIAAQVVRTPLTLSASASSKLAISFASTTPTVCTVATGSTAAVFLMSGACTITASQSGGGDYTPVSASQTFTVNPEPQKITFASIPAQNVTGSLTLSASASSGLAVTFTLAPKTTTCSLTGNVLTFLAAGDCSVIANQGGNASFAAAPAVEQVIMVNPPKAQTITFSTIGKQTVGTPLTLTATASSGLAVSFTASPASVCTVSGTKVTFLAPGSCTIMASQAGGSGWAAASVSECFSVAGFTLTPLLATLPVTPGLSGIQTITVGLMNGFSGTVTFSASGLPSGAIYSFAPGSSSLLTLLTIHLPAATSAGKYTITVGGAAGTVTASTTFTLNVL